VVVRLARISAPCENGAMVIHGQILNGVVVPVGELSLPEGTFVTITVNPEVSVTTSTRSPKEQACYLEALAKIDTVTNENPGDSFQGTDHDQALYGENG